MAEVVVLLPVAERLTVADPVRSYTFRRFAPPQNSEELPLQLIVQPSVTETPPLENVLPQSTCAHSQITIEAGGRVTLTALATVFNSGEEIVRCLAGGSAERDCLSTSGTDTIGERTATHSAAVASRVSTRRIQNPSIKADTENDSRIASSRNPVANARVSDGACWGGPTASEKCQPAGPTARLGSISGARHVAIRIGSDRPSGCDLIATIYRQCQPNRTSGASVRG